MKVRATLHDYKSVIDKYNNATKNLDDYEGMTAGEVWAIRQTVYSVRMPIQKDM